MRRTIVRRVGSYARYPIPPSTQQQQHYGTPASNSSGRSHSVLAALLRMRFQFQRLRPSQQQEVIAVLLKHSTGTHLFGCKGTASTNAASTSLALCGEEEEGPVSQRSSSTAHQANLQAGLLLCAEAQRLLRKETRVQDALSDVAVSSARYAMEVGKLLSTAAAFGAATSFLRVQEVCEWIRENLATLRTPRQIMSLCTPLLNLADGATAGSDFVVEVLWEPLLLTLQEVGLPSEGTVDASASQDDAVTQAEQHLVAIISAFGLVAKWVALQGSNQGNNSNAKLHPVPGPDVALPAVPVEVQRERMLMIAEASLAALMRLSTPSPSDGAESAAQPTLTDLMQAVQGLHCLETSYSLTATSAPSKTEKEVNGSTSATERMTVCYAVLQPLLDQAIATAESGSIGRAEAPLTWPAPRAPSTSTNTITATTAGSTTAAVPPSSHLRMQEVIEVVQAGLYPSVDVTHTACLLRYSLQQLPSALGAASARELCLVTQIVNKVRQQHPAALPPMLLQAIIAALRPRLFLLRETQAYQFRPLDCSILLSQLSRWEEVAGVTISNDVVDVLAQRFGEQMAIVEAAQLVPFVLALARVEERHWRPAEKEKMQASIVSAGGEHGGVPSEAAGTHSTRVTSARRRRRRSQAVRYHYLSTSRVLHQCVQRAGVLAARGINADTAPAASLSIMEQGEVHATRGGKSAIGAATAGLSANDAAQLLGAFVLLSPTQAETFFAQVEPLFTQLLRQDKPASMSSADAATLHTRIVVQEAITRFVAAKKSSTPATTATASSLLNPLSSGTATQPTEQRAASLLARMEHAFDDVICLAQAPKDLVMVAALLRRRLTQTRPSAIADEGEEEEENTDPQREEDDVSAAEPVQSADMQTAICFARQVLVVAPACSGYQTGALAHAVGACAAAGVLPPLAAQEALTALWNRCVSGLQATDGVAHSSGFTLSLDDCKRLMDASRHARTGFSAAEQAVPLIFLDAFTDACTGALTAMITVERGVRDDSRGNPRAYEASLSKLRRQTALGRSVVSYLSTQTVEGEEEEGGGTMTAAAEALLRQTAWRTAAEAYLELLRAIMENYAAEAALSESWLVTGENGAEANAQAPPAPPMELLSLTAHVTAQLHRRLHWQQSSEMEEAVRVDVPAEEDDTAATVLSLEAHTADVPLAEEKEDTALETVDQAIIDTLSMLGDTIALLLQLQQQGATDLGFSSPEQRTVAEGQEAIVLESTSAPPVNPKHLVMLLQAFETVHYRHAEMLYAVLPALRDCAASMGPLDLSLLLRALAKLGVWNNRLLQTLAAAVEEKVRSCELRQCHTLLRGICRSGCVSADTFVELRGTTYTEWSTAQQCGNNSSSSEAASSPLQRLAEAVLWRLDAMVRMESDFCAVAESATLTDLVQVTAGLRFFHVPPPATYDAFVILAVRRLVSTHSTESVKTVVRQGITLLGAIAEMRQPTQQHVSATALWEVLQRKLSTEMAAAQEVLTLSVCWDLVRLLFQHSLLFGVGTVHRFLVESVTGENGSTVTLGVFVQGRFAQLLAAYERGPAPSADASLAEGHTASPTFLLPPLSVSGWRALRWYAHHTAPALLRRCGDLDEHLCFPLRLAYLINSTTDLVTLVRTPQQTAPAAQAKAYVRLVACLVRADLWRSTSLTSTERTVLVGALQRLWHHADLYTLLRDTPRVFTTEELVVLAAAAAQVESVDEQREAGVVDGSPTTVFEESAVYALRELCSEAAEWRLSTSVDVWGLFTSFTGSSSLRSALTFRHLADQSELYEVLGRSGEVLLQAVEEARSSSSEASRTRAILELLRLLPVEDTRCVAWLTAAGGTVSHVPVEEEARYRSHVSGCKERFAQQSSSLHQGMDALLTEASSAE